MGAGEAGAAAAGVAVDFVRARPSVEAGAVDRRRGKSFFLDPNEVIEGDARRRSRRVFSKAHLSVQSGMLVSQWMPVKPGLHVHV